MTHLFPNSVRSSRGLPNRCRVRPAVEALEDRTVPTVIPVTTLNDNGGGSLRAAIDTANASPDADTIVFDPSIRGRTFAFLVYGNVPSSTPTVPEPAGPSALLITSPITIQGSGETLTRAAGATAFRLFQVTAAGNLTLKNLTLSNGLAQGGAGSYGGGGAAGLGGAIYNQGTLSLIGCTLTGNQAIGGDDGGAGPGGGGGLGGPGVGDFGGPPNGAVAGNAGFGGGGRYTNAVSGSGGKGGFGGGGGFGDFSGGDGGFGGGGGGVGGGPGSFGNGGPGGFGGIGGSDAGGAGGGLGGAIFNQGGIVTLANSTLTANTAQGGSAYLTGQNGGGYGGGIFNLNGLLILTNVTVAANTVQAGTGGAANNALGGALYSASVNVGTATASQNATVTVANSILSSAGPGSTLHNYQDQPTGSAVLNATGPNIVFGLVANHNGTVSGTPFEAVDPLLGPLANNGGPTPTMALLAGSPAINAGSTAVALAAGLTTDQRGFGRVGAVDLGAFEFGASPPAGTGSGTTLQRVTVEVARKHGRRQLRVFDAATGALKFVVFPFGKSFQGRFQVATGDVNGDGFEDVFVSSRRGHKRFSRVFSGRDGARLA